MKKVDFIIIAIVGLVLRLLLSAISFHSGDAFIWNFLSEDIFKYNLSPFIWWSQGPINFFIIYFTGFLENIFNIENIKILNISRHLIFILGDILVFILSYKIVERFFYEKRYLYSLIIWLNPLLIFISSVHGQSEQWMLFFSLLAIYLISIGKETKGYLAIGASISVKYLLIIFLPVIAIFKVKKIKDFLKIAIYPFLVLLSLFGFLFLINYYFYGDSNLFIYMGERIGILKGNFVPSFSSSQFVATGMNLWGGINQLHFLSFENTKILEKLKDNWFLFFGAFYFSYIIMVYIKERNVELNEKEFFYHLVLHYIIIYSVFLFFFPMTVGHRFINLIPIVFLFFYKRNISLLPIINFYFSLLVLGIIIYGKNSFFILIDKSDLITGIFLLLSVLIPSNLLILNKKNMLLFFLFIFTFGFMFYLSPGNKMHPIIMLESYVLLFILITFLIKGNTK